MIATGDETERKKSVVVADECTVLLRVLQNEECENNGSSLRWSMLSSVRTYVGGGVNFMFF
jgi:hypothetical protein